MLQKTIDYVKIRIDNTSIMIHNKFILSVDIELIGAKFIISNLYATNQLSCDITISNKF